MKFLLAIYGSEEMWGSLSKEEFDALIAEHGAFEQEVRESGGWSVSKGSATRSTRGPCGCETASRW